MKRGFKIAIGGKGGVGKTTVCALLAELLSLDGFDVLAIDADSDPNLASALGISAEKNPVPLIEMKYLIKERTGAEPGTVGQYFKLNPEISDLPEKYSIKANGVKLLSLGGIENAGSGCACPEGAFLKALLGYSLLHSNEVVLVDLAAGLEFMGRACVRGIDAMIVVVEPGARSIETATNIAKMSTQLGIPHIGAFINKVTDDAQVEAVRSQLGDIKVLGSYGYDASVQTADLTRSAVMDASESLVTELKKTKELIMESFFSEFVTRDSY
ncbi:MAG: AAA family ATPase [Planctomycetes bacterium]|nr:AAA family ATPase [Planctomycetota bacterium]